MLIGYILLRKYQKTGTEQNALLAIEALVRARCDRIYLDFLTQKKTQLALVLSSLKAGDILVIPKSKILGESRASFLQIIQILQREGVHLQSIEEDYFLTASSSFVDCFNLATRLFPNEEITLSNCQSFALPQEQKKDGGRPAIPEEKKELIRLLRLLKINQKKINQSKITITKICRLASVSRQSYYNIFPRTQKSA